MENANVGKTQNLSIGHGRVESCNVRRLCFSASYYIFRGVLPVLPPRK
jgi:hypothetical protein